MLIKLGYNVMHLNSFMLEGLSKERHKLDDLVKKSLTTYEKAF